MFFAYLRVRTIYDTSQIETEHLELPYSPLQAPGNHTESASLTLTSNYIGIRFEIDVAVEYMGTNIDYDFELLSEILADQAAEEKARRDELYSSLLTYSIFVALGIGVVLGCMVNTKRN